MKKNDLLEQVLREKDWLLKEVNHRVKNNLHTILSLLEAQAQNLKDDALEAIETSQHRIFAVTLIHKKLYTNDMADLIDMSVYMTELIAYLKEGFGEPQNIRIVTDIQPMELLASRAISLGLILNEGLTNAMRYAFADGRNGIIWVSLRATEDRIHLNITDNGMGFPMKINTSEPHMGTAIMRGLVDEMDGEITIDGSKGTEINVSFERIIQLPHYPLEAV